MEQYERLKILGVGSYGKVYLMRHRQQRRLVCAKIIKIKNIPRKEREACRTEVELLRNLHHPNIVGYKDSFLTPRKDHLCIVMEYCDGGDLSTQIKNARKRLFPESKILHWFVQIALGLHYMHGRLVLHRDLKTQNIFLLGNGRLVLGDLGISKVLEGTMDFASTRIGTPYYMSPELFNNKPYNHKSDIWALGCVLYEMAALTHAFDATSLHGLAQRVAKGRYPSIHVKYSRNLRELISRMLSTSPEKRPDLDKILQLGFIKKHIHNFLADIVSRESHKIGEGTMVLKAAAVNMLADAEGPSGTPGYDERGAIAGLGSNQDMLALKRQMEELGLQDEVKRALQPPAAVRPTDARTAAKAVKEQTGALRREEDRRKAVESALARLRKEREERLRLRHAAEGRNPPSVVPPPPPPNPGGGGGGGSNHTPSRVGGAWQAGVVGVGVASSAGSGEPTPDEGRGRKAGAAAGRKLEPVAPRRVGGLLPGGGGREPRQGRAAGRPDVRSQAGGGANPRGSRQGRRSLEPRRECREVLDRKHPSRIQSRRRSFGGGEGRKAFSPGMGGAVAAGMGGGGGRARSNGADDPTSSDVARVKDLDKFGRAREAERLAAEAMARREEAACREAARKREEALQRERERDRLRRDKVELDRKMLERERRQRAAAAASKAAEAKAKEAREALMMIVDQKKRPQEQNPAPPPEATAATTAAATPPSASPAVTAAAATDPATEAPPTPAAPEASLSPAAPEPGQQQLPAAAVEAAQAAGAAGVAATKEPGNAATATSAATTAAAPPPALSQPPPAPPRVRARWAHAGTGAGETAANASNSGAPTRPAVATPATPAGETSTVWEVIERRKREKAELEEAVSRKEAVAHREREEKEKDRRANNPPPPPPAPRPPSSGSNNAAAPLAGRGPDVARQGGDSNGNSSNASLSSHASDSDEESEDSENLPWGLGRRTAAGKAAKGAASFLEEGIVGRRMDEESRKGLRNVPVGGGGGGGDGGDGERAQGADAVSREGSDDGGEDEADEDIHAREELLEVELQMATMRCEELRHNLQETKSMIPATALVVVDGGGGSAVGVRSGGGRGQERDESNWKEAHSTAPPIVPLRQRVEAEEEEDDEEEDEEEDGEEDGDEGMADEPRDSVAGSSGSGTIDNNRGGFRGGRYYGDKRPRVRRAWGQAADDDAGVVLPEGAAGVAALPTAPAAGRRTWGIGAGSGGGIDRDSGGGNGGGIEARKVQQVGGGETGGGGGGSDSSEGSRNSFYPYDQSQLESEAKALNSHGGGEGAEEEAQPKKLFQRRSWSQASQASGSSSSSSGSASSANPARPAAPAAGKGSRSSGGTRESKRASRHGGSSTSSTALPPPHVAASTATAIGSAGVRGRAEARTAADDAATTGSPPAAAAAGERPPRAETPSPPPSAPAGRLADRIRTLRERCCLGLGVEAFEKAYGYLKAQEALDELSGESVLDLDVDREERLIKGLTDILGENKIRYYSLIDQLIFIENTHIGPG